ncbi:MAG: hypothetical protein JJ934_06765 [Pseudomonadales bacterium]|nr:hypothetical protein [Pseudomonadales bacterium]MBO6563685.1 hypothetical protein [Pseudomonadales bacterium]MBO6594770.1 hypothetical protein [Pseudomonadales bacterium]MBO6656575.1 hypothetical protein [Pseudomonadales bacterium]MBO6821670.1 hypothetical protein [Pseudomonadales bacterium]
MSLLGEKCPRCGTTTRHEVDGSVTCEGCEKETAVLVEASKEALRSCPTDGTGTSNENAHMMAIDRGPECHGICLDGGKLERLKGGVEAGVLLRMANGFRVPLA